MSSKRDYDHYHHYDNDSNGNNYDRSDRRRKRKSRWGTDDKEKVFIPGMPTIIPSNMDKQQEEIYLLQLQIEALTRRLLTGDLGINDNPEERSPSPEPIYNSEGKRLNTREFRTRKKFEDERHSFILKMLNLNANYKPPGDYKPPQTKISEKVLIPQEEYPDINFVGLIIGPRGNTLKGMERDTSAKIIIRGKGSVKEGKLARKDGQPLPGEDEPLHAFVTGPTQESVVRAVQKINEVIQKGIELPENQNDLRRSQLRELALLNGTLRENDGPRCTNCGANTHRSWQCPDKPNVTNNVFCTNCSGVGHIARDCKEARTGGGEHGPNKAKIDEEYLSLMAELGEAPPPPPSVSSHKSSLPPAAIMPAPKSEYHPPPPSSSSSSSSSSRPSHSESSWNNNNNNNYNNGASAAPPSNGTTSWSGYNAAPGGYDHYNSAGYSQMWDQNGWPTQQPAVPVPPVVPPPPPSYPPSTKEPTPTHSGGGGAYGSTAGYDSNQWSQYAQWYAASANGSAGSTNSSASSFPYPPPVPGAPPNPPVYNPPPPPPPPTH